MTLKKKIFIITGSVLFTLLVLLPAVAIAIIKWGILPPHKLTPIVLNIVNPMIEGEIECERIELTLRETFPRVGLRLTGGAVVSNVFAGRDAEEGAAGGVTDTLLRFSSAVVSVDVMDYLKRDRITIDRLGIDTLFFYGRTDPDGRANWDILTDSGDGEADTSAFPMPFIDLQRLRVREAHIIYDDRQEEIFAEVKGFNLRMRNTLTKGNLNVKLGTGFEYLIFDTPFYSLRKDVSARLEGEMDLSRGKVSLTETKLTVNELPFTLSGSLAREEGGYLLDIGFDFKAADIAQLLDFVPDEYFRNRNDLQTRGAVGLEGKVTGIYNDSLLPNLEMRCVIGDAGLSTRNSGHGIRRLDADLDIYLNPNYPDSSYVRFPKLEIEGTNTSLSASGRADQIFTDPYVDARLKGTIDFAGLAQDIINPDSIRVRGSMRADIEAAFRVSEVADGNFGNLRAAGSVEIDRMLLADRIARTSVFMRGVRFSADTTRQQSRYLTNDDLFSARLTVDTMSLRYQGDMNARIGKLDMELKTSRTIDTTSVVPATTVIRMESLSANLPDSTSVLGRKILVAGGIKASQTDNKKGVFAGTIALDTMRYLDAPTRTRMSMVKPVFSVEVMPRRDARRRQREREAAEAGDSATRSNYMPGRLRSDTARLTADGNARSGSWRGGSASEGALGPDSTRTRRSGRDTVARTETTSSQDLLRNWEVRGRVKFNSARLFTGMFPLPLSMQETTVSFDTDKLTLKDARLKAGRRSDFLLNGEITGMRGAMLRGGTVKAEITLVSEQIDCDQLMRAVNRSSLYQKMISDSLGGMDTLAMLATLETEVEFAEVEMGDDDDGLFVVPANLDLVLNTTAGRVLFDSVELRNLEGQIIVRNQSVNLRKLNIESDMGDGNLTMVYVAKDKTKADTGFELELNNIIVEELIKLFPSIDSLVPMLRSFEGVVDCQISATCELDSMMNVVFPSIHSACYLNGENMVLMDGETFAEISKKLMFKNKERNLIDYISVDLHIRDNKIEVFPFMVEIDRYKLAVGGEHYLDMTFDYHVSVLKSPVPFKLGLDIKGDLDNFKFKIVKCRYKNLFTPAREQQLAETRLNLRSSIRSSIRDYLFQNAPELAEGYTNDRIRTRRPEPVLTEEETAEVEEIEVGEDDEKAYEEYIRRMEELENPPAVESDEKAPTEENSESGREVSVTTSPRPEGSPSVIEEEERPSGKPDKVRRNRERKKNQINPEEL